MTIAMLTVKGQLVNRKLPGNSDSTWVQSVRNPFSFLPEITSQAEKMDSIEIEKRDSTIPKKTSFLVFKQGYLQYNLNYRAQIDTPYAESNIYQHTAMVNADFVIAGALPVNVSYFERQSNSLLFRDFRDVRVDVNGPELQRMRMEKIRTRITQQLKTYQDKQALADLDSKQAKLGNLKGLLQQPKLVELLIQSKERLIHLNEHDASSKWKDSVEFYASRFVSFYEVKQAEVKKLEHSIDSLQGIYKNFLQKFQRIQKVLHQQAPGGESIKQLQQSLKDAGMEDKELPKFPGILYSLKKLSLGRTMPDFSPLTVKNINVKGVNAEFGNGSWYAAFTAGAVDFRLRDFAYATNRQSPQFVYAARAGLGSREGTHIFVTGYKGKKQTYSFNSPSQQITGAGLEVQYTWKRNHRVTAEMVQSSTAGNTKVNWDGRDNRAYNLQWHSYFPQLKANIEGFYQNTGILFQSFNSYRVNAATESWYLKYDQYFFKQQLRLHAAIRKNDYANPLIAQQYTTNTVFKTLQATFRRRKWPTLSIGYIPSSQYTIVDNTIFESRYQTLTTSIYHTYKAGAAVFSTNAFYSRFYNQGSDSGFVYYNAKNISVYQQMQFALHTATIAATISKSAQFILGVYQVGAGTTIRKVWQVEAGLKINNLNNTITKTGMYLRTSLNVEWLGQLSCWYDDGYLPGLGTTLTRNQQMNIGFTRRIK